MQFEEDLTKLVKTLRFQKVDNKFQSVLPKDLKDIQSLLHQTLTAADRTSNMCQLSKEEYSNLLQNAITSKHNKTDKLSNIYKQRKS